MARIPLVYCKECNGKRLYRTEIQARDGLGRILREKTLTKRDDVFGIYRCEHHPGFWHLGHDPKALKMLHDHLRTKGKKL